MLFEWFLPIRKKQGEKFGSQSNENGDHFINRNGNKCLENPNLVDEAHENINYIKENHLTTEIGPRKDMQTVEKSLSNKARTEVEIVVGKAKIGVQKAFWSHVIPWLFLQLNLQ